MRRFLWATMRHGTIQWMPESRLFLALFPFFQAIYSALFIAFQKTTPGTSRFGISQYGGAGKTQLMLKYAWLNRFAYSGGVYMIEVRC